MREATPADAPLILGMAKAHYLENVPKQFVFNDQIAGNYIEACLKIGAIGYVSDDGFIFGEVMDTWFGENRMVHGPLCYIKPESRNGFTARRFLRAFISAAKDKAKYVYTDSYNLGHGRALNGLLRIEGFDEIGKIYLKEFKVCQP